MLNVLGICAGVGGLELGLQMAEPSAHPVCFIEADKFCHGVLSRRWPDVPIWSDVLTFDPCPWVGYIDVVAAGFPCQPWSCAGRQLGTEDERHLFPAIAEIIRVVGPEWVFLENVPGLVTGGGLPLVLGSLAEMGFAAEYGEFSCGSLGASHLRRRFVLLAKSLANSKSLQCGQRRKAQVGSTGHALWSALEYSDRLRGRGDGIQDPWRCETKGPDKAVDYSNSSGLAQRKEQSDTQHQTIERSCRALWAPGPEHDWSAIPRDLWPSEQPVCGMADGIPSGLDRRGFPIEPDRKPRVKALGNAFSPPVAAVGWRVLKSRLT